MDLNRNEAQPNAGAPPRQEWLAPEVQEFDILQTTQAGPAGVSDSGIFS